MTPLRLLTLYLLLSLGLMTSIFAQNPILFADVPDASMVRVGDTYYMSSTTMHMSPGLPIMKSNDLVNWTLINYAYDTLANMDELNLVNGKSTYGRGSWASSIRYHNGLFYVTTFAQTTGRTYIFTTPDLEKGPWKVSSFKPSYHDHSLFFDDDGKVYLIYGAGKIKLLELESDASRVKASIPEKVIIDNASAPAGTNIMLNAEGSQLFKVNGKYYLFHIVWPRDGMRTVLIHRADKIDGPYEGRVALQDRGIAQGGLIDTPNGRWFAYLFRDYGSVGRIPHLVPVEWKDGWPVLGINGIVPDDLSTFGLPASRGLIPNIVASDEFDRKTGERELPLAWQWNHNPDNKLWSLRERKGLLRLKTGRIDTSLLQARNTLTQRTIGPQCVGSTSVDISAMKDGDFAGLMLLQKNYGAVGVRVEGKEKFIVMRNAASREVEKVRLKAKKVYFKAECDFRDKKDVATFFYSTDNKTWNRIGSDLTMSYTLPHFMGYRFGLFNYSTKNPGGYVDFDYFRISGK